MDDPLNDWRYRWSRLCIVDDKWHYHKRGGDPEYVHLRRWRWFNPVDLARMATHRSWAKRYF